MSSMVLALPDEVLKLVMHHVPLADRLRSCCLVSTKFHAAATAATGAVSAHGSKSEWSLHWLARHGQHVTRLFVIGLAQPLQQLPCLPRLLDLELWADSTNPQIQVGPGEGYPGVLQGLSKLARLVLRCNIMDAPRGMPLGGCLSTLIHLRHLSVTPQLKPFISYSVQGLHSAVLPRLTCLSHLHVRSLTVENLLQLSALTGCLQHLDLDVEGVAAVGPSSVPGLVLPASLTNLVISMDIEVGLLSLVPTRLQDLSMEGSLFGPVEGPGSFLSCLARLQCLTRLWLYSAEVLAWPAPGPAFSALTASSSLVELGLENAALPEGAWQYVFPATRQLLHLTCLDVGWNTIDWGQPAPAAAWGAADLRCLVSCCPNLCCLFDEEHEVSSIVMQHGLHVSELHKLTAVTHLEVQFGPGDVGPFRESLRGVAAVTQLQDLAIYLDSTALTVGALLPLTRLTALTALQVFWHPDSEAERVCLTWETEDAPYPDVWLQLLELCAKDPSYESSALLGLAQQSADQQRTIGEQQQQLAGMQQQLSGVQEELAAQQQVVAAQDARIASLEGQLQEMRAQLQLLLQR